MKIAFVAAHANPLPLPDQRVWSQSVHVAELARALVRAGHAVTVLTRRDDPRRADVEALPPGVVVRHLDAGPAEPLTDGEVLDHLDDFTTALRCALAAEQPDVVHAHWWLSGRAALTAAWPLGVPLVQTFHGLATEVHHFDPTKDTSAPERLAVEQTLVRRVEHILASSSAELFELLRMGGEMQRISIVAPGVDVHRFTPEGPVELRHPRRHRLVAIGRLIEQRGFADAIRALPELPDAELVIAGGPVRGPLHADPVARSLRAMAADLGVGGRVHLRGRLATPNLPALIRSADAVVCVPWYEPSGSPALEAMACGVPPVVSAVGAHTELVVDGVTGLHVPPGRPAALAPALEHLLGDPDLRARLGSAGVRRARARYSWDRAAQTASGIYERLNGGTVAADGSAVTPSGTSA